MNTLRLYLQLLALSWFMASAGFAENTEASEVELRAAGLTPISVPGFDSFWLKPGTNLQAFDAVQLAPLTVRFSASWLRRYNRDQRSLADRLDETDLAPIVDDLIEDFDRGFAGKLTRTGDGDQRGLRIQAELIDVVIRYPDLPSAGRKEVLVQNAGEATLILRFNNAESGELLGWARDRRQSSADYRPFRRATRAFNRFEFSRLFGSWARQLEPRLAASSN